jgi:hypothetical protein
MQLPEKALDASAAFGAPESARRRDAQKGTGGPYPSSGLRGDRLLRLFDAEKLSPQAIAHRRGLVDDVGEEIMD